MADKNDQLESVKPVDEDGEIQAIQVEAGIKYYLTPKYMHWEELFFAKGNHETFGNATQSAIIAYNLDPNDPKAYNVASVMGHRNVRKVKDIRKRYWEKRGLTQGKLLDLYNKFMYERKDINLLYSVADDLDIELPVYKSIINAKDGLSPTTQINAKDVQVTFSPMEVKK